VKFENTFIHQDARVNKKATLSEGSKVWGFAQIRENASIGLNCNIGKGSYVGVGVKIGNNCKIQNNALIYAPSILADGVFVGPGAILTNDKHPGAISDSGEVKGPDDWKMVQVLVEMGASIGAGAVCVAPVTIGEFSTVGAGTVVLRDVPKGSTVVGNPAREIG
jgi:acetyltransferase-like isoleucine patch superfamily enzyme